ncbi:hypothetical protein SAMN05421770_101820 [Granulicella rosea]|uniref:Uncharacterized protein n=1 Tax=Granulicella rosea TaxID=474952 RepID=A0A239E689_9BACT|nr:hypothetical protein [Granulicella rosea]SNS40137.1 hypothetical protein SAMN05421770_101820 [Granulicella rosea]
MEDTKKYLVIAVLLTVLDVSVAWSCGGMIWRSWAGILWCRMSLELLAAGIFASLADVWAYVYRGQQRAAYPAKTGFILQESDDV